MAQTSFEENMNSRKVRQPLDDARSIDRSRGSEGTRVTIDRIKKMEKILALVDSPYEGEALAAARMVLRLIQAWGIDLQSLRFSSGDLVDSLLENVAKSSPENFSWSHGISTDHLSGCSDPEAGRVPSLHLSKLIRNDGMAVRDLIEDENGQNFIICARRSGTQRKSRASYLLWIS